jgi:hypothetical protein
LKPESEVDQIIDVRLDPRDLVQGKYELLRRVSLERVSVTDATEEYGVSRPTASQTEAHFAKAGVAGLVPHKRGPRGPHKLQGEALGFVEQHLVPGEPARARALAKRLREQFDLPSHPRTIERAVVGKKTARLGIHESTLVRWAEGGLVTRHAYNTHAYLYEVPDPNLLGKHCSRWDRLVDRSAALKTARAAKPSYRTEGGAV